MAQKIRLKAGAETLHPETEISLVTGLEEKLTEKADLDGSGRVAKAVTAENCSGSAERANADGSGNNIAETYATKEELGTATAGFVTEEDLGDYATKAELEKITGIEGDLATKKDLESYAQKSELGDYATKAELGGYAQKSDLEGKADVDAQGRVAKAVTAESCSGSVDRATSDGAGNNIAETYATKSELDAAKEGLVTQSELNEAKEGLVTQAELNEAKEGLVTQAELDGAKRELEENFSGFTGDFASKTDLKDYATKAELETAKEGLVTQSELGSYATKAELGDYARKSELGDYATDAELTAGLAKKADLDENGRVAKAVTAQACTGTAAQAAADGGGHNIIETYATKSELEAFTQGSGKYLANMMFNLRWPAGTHNYCKAHVFFFLNTNRYKDGTEIVPGTIEAAKIAPIIEESGVDGETFVIECVSDTDEKGNKCIPITVTFSPYPGNMKMFVYQLKGINLGTMSHFKTNYFDVSDSSYIYEIKLYSISKLL